MQLPLPLPLPLPLWATPHRFRPTLPDLLRKVGAETIAPEADAFVANIDPTFVKQVFHISQRQRKSDVHHHTKLDDLGRGFEIAERILGHFPRLNALTDRLKPVCADNAQSPAIRLRVRRPLHIIKPGRFKPSRPSIAVKDSSGRDHIGPLMRDVAC